MYFVYAPVGLCENRVSKQKKIHFFFNTADMFQKLYKSLYFPPMHAVFLKLTFITNKVFGRFMDAMKYNQKWECGLQELGLVDILN